MSSIGWEHAPVVHGGRKYKGNHWRSLTLTWSTAWNVEAAYDAHRHGDPVSKHGHVMIAIPCYQDPAVRMLASLDAVTRDLREKGGLEVSVMMTPGDSLVTRGRDAILHRFMKSTANRLLFWDNDLECLMPEAVRGMLRAQERNAQEGNPGTIIGGAYPFRDGTGRIVANLGSRVPELRSDKCIEVDAVGTGFMLIHRDTVSRLMHLHPERMYIQDCGHDKDEIAWSLFASEISFGASLRDREKRRLLSEDWFFCQLWREAEGKVLLYAPAKFKHWGRHGHEGNVLDAWNVQAPKQEKTTLPSCKQKFHRMSDNALVECCLAEGHPKEIAHAWEDQVP